MNTPPPTGQARTPILMYHSIAGQASAAFRPYTVPPARFAAHLDHLAAAGYHTLTMRELAALRRTGHRPPADTIVLTFDDAYADFHHTALPQLRRHGFTATVYVVTGYVGATAAWLGECGEGDRPMMGWTQLAEAADAGIECAAHSHTHPQLDRLPRPAIRQQIRRSRAELEDHLGRPVDTFAHPFGYHDRRVRAETAAAGFGCACAVDELTSAPTDDDFAIPRLTVHPDDDVPALAALLARRRTPAHTAIAHAKQLAWREYRRLGQPHPARGGDPG